jgi:hypothetical protein
MVRTSPTASPFSLVTTFKMGDHFWIQIIKGAYLS